MVLGVLFWEVRSTILEGVLVDLGTCEELRVILLGNAELACIWHLGVEDYDKRWEVRNLRNTYFGSRTSKSKKYFQQPY